MMPARFNSENAIRETEHVDRCTCIRFSPIAQLPSVIVSPAEDATGGSEGARVPSSSRNGADWTSQPCHYNRGVLVVEFGPIPKLTGLIGAPAEHFPSHVERGTTQVG